MQNLYTPSTHPIYGRPVQINQPPQMYLTPQQVKKPEPVLKVNLTSLTIVSSLLVTIVLISFLFIGCNTIQGINCSLSNPPMISKILEYQYYDRIFIYIITYFGICVYFSNVRAYYSKFAPYFNKSMNTTLYYLGTISSFIIPFVGIIDESLCNPVHSTFAVIFFICSVVYIYLFTSQLKQHGVQILQPNQVKYLELLNVLRWTLIVLLPLGLLSSLLYGPHYLTPWCEWIGTILMLNFFAIAAPIDDYVECVAPEDQIQMN